MPPLGRAEEGVVGLPYLRQTIAGCWHGQSIMCSKGVEVSFTEMFKNEAHHVKADRNKSKLCSENPLNIPFD